MEKDGERKRKKRQKDKVRDEEIKGGEKESQSKRKKDGQRD